MNNIPTWQRKAFEDLLALYPAQNASRGEPTGGTGNADVTFVPRGGEPTKKLGFAARVRINRLYQQVANAHGTVASFFWAIFFQKKMSDEGIQSLCRAVIKTVGTHDQPPNSQQTDEPAKIVSVTDANSPAGQPLDSIDQPGALSESTNANMEALPEPVAEADEAKPPEPAPLEEPVARLEEVASAHADDAPVTGPDAQPEAAPKITPESPQKSAREGNPAAMIRDDSTVHEVGSGKAPNPNPREDDDDSSSIANLERIVPLKPQVVRNPKRQVFPRRTAAIPKDQRIPMDKPEGADARVTSEAAEEPGKDDSAAAPRLEMHEV